MSTSNLQRTELFDLTVERPNEDVAIEICDAFDKLIAAPLAFSSTRRAGIGDTSFGHSLTLHLPRGLYVVRSTLGGNSDEQIVRLNANIIVTAPIPTRQTSMVYRGVESSHEYYTYPAVEVSKKPTTDKVNWDQPADSWLLIFVRGRDRESYQQSSSKLDRTAAQLYLHTPEGNTIPLARHVTVHPDGWLALSLPAPAGDYLLYDFGQNFRTTPISLYPQWQSQLFLTFDDSILYSTLRISLARRERGFLPHDEWARAIDLGLSVLTSGRGILPADARTLLLEGKFDNPLLGLIAAWATLLDVNSSRVIGEHILANLEYLIPDSPDVAVLRAAQARRQKQPIPRRPINRIPMLSIAVSELISLAAEHPEILSADSLIDDVSPRLYVDSAFTGWQPLGNEVPAAFSRGKDVDPRLHVAASIFDLNGFESDSTAVEPAVSSGSSAWLSGAVSDVIERQARQQLRKPEVSAVSISGLANSTGVTPNAVRQALQAVPLKGLQIAMSLSKVMFAVQTEELEDTSSAVDNTAAQLAQALIADGASLAYGGDSRREGYTELLGRVIKSYNATQTRESQYLHAYQASILDPIDQFSDLPLIVHHLADVGGIGAEALVPGPSETENHPRALYFSDVRRLMARHTFGRVSLGGQAQPAFAPSAAGYRGLFPGVAEEAWRTLQADKPLYVAGGFGGAAALVVELLEGKDIPIQLQQHSFSEWEYFQETAAAIKADSFHQRLGLPESMDQLANLIMKLGHPKLASDQASLQWNGLTVAENRILFHTRNTEELITLVLQGLRKKAHP